MTMPHHKELLRSSISLRFREFFVFRNKVKGVMTLLCQFEKMIYPSGTGAADAASFMIALYRPCEKLKDSSGNTITQIKAVGYCLPTAGNMRYEMRGHWRKDPKYGIQYDVEGYEEQIIPTREGIIAYLSSGQIKGIGPKMAERIYDAFGNMALEVLDKKPEKLLTISGISQNKLKKICDSYLANRGARDVVAFLSPHGITPNRAVKLYKEYGEQTMDIVKNHPYKLCEMVGVGFKTADKIAMSMGIDRLSPERVDEGILYTLTDAEGYGNLCMERDGFIAACQKTLETPELTDQMIAARANRLILDGRMRTYESCVYREKTAKAEEKLANLIRYQIRHQNPCTYGDLDHELDREESRLKVRLAPEQRQAIKTALTSGLCIITGGPGTGKTMLQKALLGIYSRNHPSKEIVCCAPTGRAARRMEQSTGFPASTVHKALGLIAGEDGEYGDPETLDADLILVDEVSMLDIYLAGDLFDSVKPGSQLILIGDADVDNEHAKHIDYHAAFRNNGRICLREHHDLINHNAIRLILINKFDNAVPFEIPGEFVLEYAVMLRWQSHCQLDLFNGAVPTGILKLFCNGEQCQNKITVVLRFIPHVTQTLSAGCPVPSVVFQDFIRHRRLDGVLG